MANADKLASGIGFHSFRIPAIVTTKTGRMLAFAEGRRHDNRDYGDINLVYKRTKDGKNGDSISDWEGLQEVVGKGAGTWGNPTAVVDDDNTIYLWLSWNGAEYSQGGGDTLPNGVKTKKIDSTWEGRRHLYLTESRDDGKTWTDPVDMTLQLTPNGRSWDAVGPGNGIRISTGELVVPAQTRNIIGRGTPGKRTWTTQTLPGGGSEGTIVQTLDGNLMRNDRAVSTAPQGYRWVARGTLSSFGAFASDTGLPDPGCEGSILKYNNKEADAPGRVIFLNSADKDRRTQMRVRISYDDDAKKYNFGRRMSNAAVSGVGNEGGYSSMTKTADRRIGALVETDWFQAGKGDKDNNRAILFRKFNLSWILNGPEN